MITDTEERVRKYFREKSRELIAASRQSVCGHTSLSGGHRESLKRHYLNGILPKRYEVGRGVVYGTTERSLEADIVIWDSQSCPSLPLADHQFFFVESVRVVIESKTRWSRQEFADVRRKSRAVSRIFAMPGLGVAEHFQNIYGHLQALNEGTKYAGTMAAPYPIGTAAIFFEGGKTFCAKSCRLTHRAIDEDWPDLILLLEAGKVVLKTYENPRETMSGCGYLDFYEFGADSLLAFTSRLLEMLSCRSAHLDGPLSLMRYAPTLRNVLPTRRKFRVGSIQPFSIPISWNA
jgi:hypothetical protein